MSIKYYYLVCKKGLFGRRIPITICTSSEAAQKCCEGSKNYIIMRQYGEELLQDYVPKDKK